ncbi:MAG: LamG domain-containing protein [Solirubrobacteraceae bacterium]
MVASFLALVAAPAPASAATGLAGEWRLDEGTGLLAHDGSGAGQHGALGTGPNTPTWIAGVSGSALRFDGDDHVRLPDSPGLEPEYISLEAWVRASGAPGAYRYVVSKGATTCETSSYGLYTGTSRGMAFYVSGALGYVVSPQAPPAQIWNGAWHHAVGTYDGYRVRLYIDGHQIGVGNAAPADIVYGLPSRSPYIGSYRGDCELPFSGDIDGLRIWSVALEPEEVETAHDQPGGRPQPLDNDVGGGEPGAPKSCLRVTPNRRVLRVNRRARVIVTIRRHGKRVAKVRVVISGRGIKKKAKRTNRKGRAVFVVKPRRKTKLRIRTSGQRKSCPTSTLRVKGP